MVAQAHFPRRHARPRLLIIGSGDVAARMMPLLRGRFHVFALVRRPEAAVQWRALGAVPVQADLDRRGTLRRLAGLAPRVLHAAPPPEGSERDPRTRRLLAALGARLCDSGPPRVVYISTSGVYGDCGGARVPETRPLRPTTARARRRVDAESALRAAVRRGQVQALILRAPGIYAAGRLSLARLERGDPVLRAEEDVYTNHIHADDLARLAVAALTRGGNGRVFNACDTSALKMGDYYDCMADLFGLPRPPRASRAEAGQVLSPMMMSFMGESRRLDGTRLRELRVRLQYPDVAGGLAAIALTGSR